MTKGLKRFQNNGGIISTTCEERFNFKDGLGTLLFQKMLQLKTRIAQIDCETGQKDTYEALLERCVRTAIAMRARGITPDDIISVCSTNHLDTCVPLIASFFLGVKFANTDPNMSQEDTAQLLNQVRPKMVFVSQNAVKLIENVLEEIKIDAKIVVFGQSAKHLQYWDFLIASPEEKHFKPVKVKNLKETASIFFSSGTSGFPKGICLSHKSLLAQSIEASEAKGEFPMTILTYSSACWISFTVCCANTIIAGGIRLIPPDFHHISLWTLIDKFKVNMLILSTSQVAMVCHYGRPEGTNASSLLFCGAGGSPLSKEQIQTMQRLLPNKIFFLGYGLTEIGGGVFSLRFTDSSDLQLVIDKPTTCGRPISGILYKIVDPETEEMLGPNRPGELRLKTDYTMNGYYNIDSSSLWDSDGFLKTGDIAYYEEDYCFYIVDRIKEMLKYRSWQIAPAKLEAILLTHPAVASAVVVGLPHPGDGDHPLGIVILGRSYVGKVTSTEIQKYVDERVPDKQRLRAGVKILESLPLTPSGKFKKQYIRGLVIEGKL